MSTTLSIRLDLELLLRLEKLAQRTQRSKSSIAAEAIAAYVKRVDWQLHETAAGLADLDAGKEVEHDKVSRWLRSWVSRGKSVRHR
jgi:RHH-type rel operon transcriptional repressor/antitoxin RelB